MTSVSPPVCANCGGPKSHTGDICRRCYNASRFDDRSLNEIVRDPKTINRFMRKVDKDSSERGCWLWTAHVCLQTGYGEFGVMRTVQSSHVVAYRMFRGDVPAGIFVLHACDVRCCVNPSHLFLGTHQDNLIDCAVKGRINTQKLTEADVRSIRALYAAGGISQESLGKRFGVGQSQIHRIVNRQTWRFLD